MNVWKVAVYLRISKEELYVNKDSNSITNQKQIINLYIKENNDLEFVDYYIDDGYSGTDFNRPGFKKLLVDIKEKKVNTIIVKDLSRFGRNHIEVDNYLENILPIMKVRFISVNDDIDTFKTPYVVENFSIALKNLINDAYAYDVSKKVRSILRNKKINGEFIGKSAPYGYLKDSKDKHKFIVDENASKVIVKIFDMFLNGKTRKEIADELNNLKILPPGAYKIENNISNYKKTETMKKWNSDMITRILRNQVYTGDLVQGKTTKFNYRIHKTIAINPEDWIIVKNHHKAIIDKKIYCDVQNMLNRKEGYRNSNDIFSGYLKCADCGKSLIIKKIKNYEYYYCSSFIRNGSCSNHSIKKEQLFCEVLKKINNIYKYRNLKELDKKILNKSIEKIIVYENKKLKIIFKEK